MKNIDRDALHNGRVKHWGEEGAVCEKLFLLLSALFLAFRFAPTKTHKFFVGMGIVFLYVVIRTTYDVSRLDHLKLDVLTSVSHMLRQRRHAIRCAETVFHLYMTRVSFNSRVHLLSCLLYDYDIVCMYKKSHFCGTELRRLWSVGTYAPPVDEIIILRALAWFAGKYPDKNHADAKWYVDEALRLARELGADEEVSEIEREFRHLLNK